MFILLHLLSYFLSTEKQLIITKKHCVSPETSVSARLNRQNLPSLTEYTAMPFVRLFAYSQPQTAPALLAHIAFHWQFWQKPGCLLPLLMLLSAPLQNLCTSLAKALNIKIKHVLKISERNRKLSLKISMIPGPVKLHKLRVCYKRKLKGNNWGYWLCTSNRNPSNTHDTVNQAHRIETKSLPLWKLKKNLQQGSLRRPVSSPDFYHCHSRFYPAHNVFPHLSVCLCSLPKIVPDFLTGLV